MSQTEQITTPSADLHGFRALQLIKPHRRLLLGLPRSMPAVVPKLRDLLAELADGLCRWPLFVWGPVGSGKTSAALAMADIVATAAYFTPDSLCLAFKQTWTAGAAAEADLLETIAGKDLLIIDELGTRKEISDFHYSSLKTAVDLRDQRAGREAIYISNHEPGELARLYDDRLASRILCGTRFELTGRDRRFES